MALPVEPDSEAEEPVQGVVVFSSAVPVLPATVTPGMAAEVPVPSRTTAIIRRRIVCATDWLMTVVVAVVALPWRNVG